MCRADSQSRDHSHHLGRIVFVALFCCRILLAQAATEYHVKAAYLFNFAKLAEWPAGALPDASLPLSLCVLGSNDDFVDALRSTVTGKTAAGHAILVRAARTVKELSSCQLVFVRSNETSRFAAAAATLSGASTLLVGEDEDFLTKGGMINLSLADGKVRFQVNKNALDLGHIGFASSFLALASTEGNQNSSMRTAGSRAVSSSPSPEMPDLARKMNLSGAVQLQATVRPDGSVKDVRVVGGHPLLADAAVHAVRQWRYRAGPSETTEAVKINFGP